MWAETPRRVRRGALGRTEFMAGFDMPYSANATGLVKVIMTLPFAQFVWIVEFATEAQWAVNQVTARAVIDATASLLEVTPLWLLHGPHPGSRL
jgi:hypothetical protein